MAKEKQKNKVTLLGYDPVETPEEIIEKDKDQDRNKAFRESYKRVMQIIPDYFLEQRRKRKRKNGTTGGGTSFTQNIVITPENVKIETTEKGEQVQEEEKEREE